MPWIRFIESLLLPPAGLLWLGAIGLLLLVTRYKHGPPGGSLGRKDWGRRLLALSFAGLFIISTPLCTRLLLASLDRHPPLPAAGTLPEAEAIVILGAGERLGALEEGGDTVSRPGLERLFYGASLARRTDLPILVSGGSADAMAAVLEHSFRLGVRWRESTSRNTHENAVFSARILRGEGVARVFLVTHFWHMPRSVAAFENAGLTAVPAPLGFSRGNGTEHRIKAFLPRPWTLTATNDLLHEWVGRLWYRLRYGY